MWTDAKFKYVFAQGCTTGGSTSILCFCGTPRVCALRSIDAPGKSLTPPRSLDSASTMCGKSDGRCVGLRVGLKLFALILQSVITLSLAEPSGPAVVLRMRGGQGTAMLRPERPVTQARGSTPTPIALTESETLGTQRARLRAGTPPPTTASMSLVNPLANKEGGGLEPWHNYGEAQEVGDAKKFKAFKGSGRTMLTTDQIKTASSGQMHRLALARLARLQVLEKKEWCVDPTRF